MFKSTKYKGFSVIYWEYENDGMKFADIVEVSDNDQILDLSVAKLEEIKKAIYQRDRLSKIFEQAGKKVSAKYWGTR